MYHNYAAEETGDYDLNIWGVTADFFERMESLVRDGHYQKYEADDAGGDVAQCTKKAWEAVWAAQKNGEIRRAFTVDYESAVPPPNIRRMETRTAIFTLPCKVDVPLEKSARGAEKVAKCSGNLARDMLF